MIPILLIVRNLANHYLAYVLQNLDTIQEEAGNCHLYEKIGYKKSGRTEVINERMTLVFYEK